MTTTEEWEAVPTDPDPESHLGYEDEGLVVIHRPTESQYLILPNDRSKLQKEEFIIATDTTLCKVKR